MHLIKKNLTKKYDLPTVLGPLLNRLAENEELFKSIATIKSRVRNSWRCAARCGPARAPRRASEIFERASLFFPFF